MELKEELRKQEQKYVDIMTSSDLTYDEKKMIEILHEKLKGHLYDQRYLVDFVRDIPSFVKFDKEDEVKALVGVACLEEFCYIVFDKNNNLSLYSACIKYEKVYDEKEKFTIKLPYNIREILKCTYHDQILIYKNFVDNDKVSLIKFDH